MQVDQSTLSGESHRLRKRALPYAAAGGTRRAAERRLTAGDLRGNGDLRPTGAAGARLRLGLPAAEAGAKREEELEKDLVFLGLMAMEDPPRPEVAEAVAKCHCAGIRLVMISGEHPLTAEAVARHIGLVGQASPRIVTCADMDALDDEALQAVL